MARQIDVTLAVQANTTQAKQALNDLNKSLSQVLETRTITLNDTSLNNAKQAALDLKTHLNAAVDVNTGKLDLSKFSTSLNKSKQSLQGLYNDLTKIGPSGQTAFLALSKSIASADSSTITLSKNFNELLKTLGTTARWQLSSSIIHGLVGAVEQAYGYAQDLNQSLNNIRIVTGASVDEMAKFAEQANIAAKGLSARTTDYTNAALIFYQQGIRDQQEIAARTETTIKLANVSRQSAEDVSNQMTAIWNNFADGSQSLEYYADVITKLGATTASSSAEIAAGLSKFSAIADTVGLSYEKATAALATVVAETRQSADVVGTAFKTMFARFQGLQLGETLEDGVTLNKYSAALDKIGVNILDMNGNLRDMDYILDATAEKWNTISNSQQVALAETVAGTRQYAQFMAIMENYDKILSNEKVAMGAEGTLQAQADIYAEGWEAASERVRAALEKIYSQLINDDFFITLLNGSEKFLGVISNVIEGLGGVKGALMLISSLMINSYAKEIPNAISHLMDNINILTGTAEKNRQTMLGQMQGVISSMRDSGPSSSNEVNAQVTTMAKVAEMTTRLAQERDKLSQAEIVAYENRIKDIQSYGELATAMGKELDVLTRRNAELRKDSEKTLRQDGARNVELVGTDDDVQQRVIDLIDPQEFQEVQSAQRDVRNLTEELNRLRTEIDNLDQSEQFSDKGDALNLRFGWVKQTLEQAQNHLQILLDGIETGTVRSSTLIRTFQEQSQQLGVYQAVVDGVSRKLEEWRKTLDQVGDNSPEIDIIVKDMQAYRDAAEAAGLETADLADALKKFADGQEDIRQLVEHFQTFADQTGTGHIMGDTIANVDALRTVLINVGLTESEVDDLGKTAQSTGRVMTQFEIAQRAAAAASTNLAQHTMELSEALGLLGGFAMQVQVAFTNLSRLGSIWSDDTLTTSEKLTQTLTVLTTVLPTLITLLNKEKLAQLDAAAARVLGRTTAVAETAAITSATGALGGLKAAAIALTGSLGIVVGIAGAVAAAITGIIYAFTEWKNRQPENQIKRAKEAVEGLNTRLSEATTAADNLRTAIDKYDSAKAALEDCTRGTEEWRDALNQTINAAHELLQLISGVSDIDLNNLYTTNNGFIEFDSDTLNSLQNKADIQQTKNSFAVDVGQYYTRTKSAELDEDIEKYSIIKELNSLELAVGRANELFELLETTDSIQDFRKALEDLNIDIKDVSDDALSGLQDRIHNLSSESSEAADKQLAVQTQLTLERILGDTYDQIVKNALSDEIADNIGAIIQDRLNWLTDQGQYEGLSNFNKIGKNSVALQEMLNDLNAARGTRWTLDKDAVRGTDSNRSFAFRDENNDEQKLTAEELAAYLSVGQALSDLTTKATTLGTALADASNELKIFLQSGDIAQLTKAQFDTFTNDINAAGGVQQYLNNEGITNSATIDKLSQGLELSQGWSDLAAKLPQKAQAAIESLTLQQAEAMSDAYDRLGLLGSEKLQSTFDTILNSLEPEQIHEVLQAFGELDFSNWDNIEDFKYQLLDIENIDPQSVSNFADQLERITQATRQIDLSSLMAGFAEVQKITGKLSTGGYIQAEDYDKLSSAAKEYFSIVADGTYQLVASAGELQTVILDEYRDNLLDSMRATQQHIDYDSQSASAIEMPIASNQFGFTNPEDVNNLQAALDVLSRFPEVTEKLNNPIDRWRSNLNALTDDELQLIAEKINELVPDIDTLNESIANNQAQLETAERAYFSTATSVAELAQLEQEFSNIFPNQQASQEATSAALISLAAGYDNTRQEIERYRAALVSGDPEARNSAEIHLAIAAAVGQEAEALGIDAEQLESIADFYAEDSELLGAVNDESLTSAERMAMIAEAAKDAATRFLKLNSGINDLADNYDDYETILDRLSKTQNKADKAMIASEKACGELRSSLADILDVNEELLSTDFLSTIDPALLNDLAEGGDTAQAALAQLRDAFIDAQAEEAGLVEMSQQLKDELAGLAEGQVIDLDNTPALNALIDTWVQAGITADEIESRLSGLGIDCDATNFLGTLDDVVAATGIAGEKIIQNTAFDAEANSVTVDNTDTEQKPVWDDHIVWTESRATNLVFKDGSDEPTQVDTVIMEGHNNPTSSVEEETAEKATTVTGVKLSNMHKSAGGKVSTSSGRSGGGGGSGKKGKSGGGKKGGGGKKKGGGGGGSAKAAKHTAKTAEAEEHRYTRITNTLDALSGQYDRLNKAREKAWGVDKLGVMDTEIKKMEELGKAYKDYLKEVAGTDWDKLHQKIQAGAAITEEDIQNASGYLNKDYQSILNGKSLTIVADTDSEGNQTTRTFQMGGLVSLLGAYGISGLELDDYGRINNKDEIDTAFDQWYAAQVNKWNTAGGEWQESIEGKNWWVEIEAIKDAFPKLFDLYSEDIEKLIENSDNLQDNTYALQDIKFEKLNEELDLWLDSVDRVAKKLEYMAKILGDNFYKIAEVMRTLFDPKGGSQYQTYLNRATDYQQYYEQAQKMYVAGQINQAQFIEAAKTAQDGIYEVIDSILEMNESMRQYYGTALDGAIEELSKLTNQMDHQVEVMNHLKNVLSLLNRDTDYAALGVLFRGTVEMRKNDLEVATREYQMFNEQRIAAEERYNQLLVDGLTEGADEYKRAVLDKIVEQTAEAEEKMYASTEDYLTAINELYTNTINEIMQRQEQMLSGGFGYDFLTETMSRANAIQDEYLTKTNQIYETNDLLRKLAKDIDKTNNQQAKTRLKNFSDEIVAMQQQERLSQTDLAIAKARYEMLLAEMALEDARDAKKTVRLQRDNEGNYGYVYTADQGDIDDAEDDLAAKRNDLYNLVLKQTNDYGQKIISLEKERDAALAALAEEYRGADAERYEEYLQKKEALTNQYNELLTAAYASYDTAIVWLNRTAATDYREAWVEEYENVIDQGRNYQDQTLDVISEIENAMHDYEDQATVVTEHVYTGIDNLEQKTQELVSANTDLTVAVEDLIPKIQDEIEQVDIATEAWARHYEEIMANIQALMDYNASINDAINAENYDKTIDYSQKMYDYLNQTGDYANWNYNGATPTIQDAEYQKLQRQREAKINGENMSVSSYGYRGDEMNNVIQYYSQADLGLADFGSNFSRAFNAWAESQGLNASEQAKITPEEFAETRQAILDNAKTQEENTAASETNTASITDNTTAQTENTAILTEANTVTSENTASQTENTAAVTENIATTIANSEALLENAATATTASALVQNSAQNLVSSLATADSYISNAASTISTSVSYAAGVISSAASRISSSSSSPTKMASGGYTGNWGAEGKIAILHEKELVLNAVDTENILQTVNLVRQLTNAIDLRAITSAATASVNAPSYNVAREKLEQEVTIHAEFPNVQDRHEIEEAFETLVTRASQYANRS